MKGSAFKVSIAILLSLPPAHALFALDKPPVDAKSAVAAALAAAPDSIVTRLTPGQRSAWQNLVQQHGTNLQVRFDPDTLTPAVISGFAHGTPHADAASAALSFIKLNWSDISAIYGLTSDDTFVPEEQLRGSASPGAGNNFVFRRYFNGYPVFDNYLHIQVVPLLDSLPAYAVTSVAARLHRRVSLGNAFASLSQANIPLAIAESSLTGTFVASEQATVIFPTETSSRLAYRVHGQLDSKGWELFIDAATGQVLLSQEQETHRTGRVRTAATNPHEVYDPSVGKSMKPLPQVNLYRGVGGTPIRGISSVFLGALDYHGSYDLPPTASDGSICTHCWAMDFKGESSGNWWINEAGSTGITNFTRTLTDILLQPDGADHDIPWSTTRHFSRRAEAHYLFEFGHHYFTEYFGSPTKKMDHAVNFDTPSGSCDLGSRDRSDCAGGGTGCNSTACSVSIGCGAMADVSWRMTNAGEINTRDTIFHEYTHNMDYASRGYWPTASAADFPGRSDAIYEGLGPFGAGLLSDFESEMAAQIDETVTYPAGYSCTNGYAGVPLTNIFNDYVLYSGAVGIQSLLWHLPLINNSTRLIDCTNGAAFEACANTNTLYSHLVTKSRDPWNTHWQSVFEASKAYHRRVTDSAPQLTCSGGTPVVGDPDTDSFPWADDTTNISYLTSVFHFDLPPSSAGYDTSMTPWGVATYAPDSCTGTLEASCQRLALNFTWDFDKWGIAGKAGETYLVQTQPDHDAVDTKLDITDYAGNVLSRCGASGTDLCTNDDCLAGCPGSGMYCSCLTFKPTSSDMYRVAVYPYQSTGWNSEVGTSAMYALKIDQLDDDHGDTAGAATPLPPDGAFRTAYLNSNSPEDYDWYYVVVAANDTLTYSLCSTGGGFTPLLNILDQDLTFQRSYWGTSCGSSGSVAVTKGVYYIKVYNPGSSIGAYQLKATLAGDIGGTKASFLNLNDSSISWPNAVRAVPGTLTGTTDTDVFRTWLQKGQIVDIDAIANVPGASSPRIKVFTPDGSFYSSWSEACVSNGIQDNSVGAPTYILQDDKGGVIRGASEVQKNAHISLVAPTSAYYFLEVSNKGTGAGGYVLYYYNSGTVLTGYPELP